MQKSINVKNSKEESRQFRLSSWGRSADKYDIAALTTACSTLFTAAEPRVGKGTKNNQYKMSRSNHRIEEQMRGMLLARCIEACRDLN